MQGKISFGNLSVTSQKFELLDYADVVIRAILENQEPRKTSRNRYYFLDVDVGYLIEDDPSSLSIYGRFVNDTLLKREQVLEDGKLVSKPDSLQTSPSAFFVFNLLDHRVSYMPETAGAPKLSTFGNTFDYFVKRKHEQFIRERGAETGLTLTSLRTQFPLPVVHLTPIASKMALGEFMEKFSKITSLSIKVVKRNQDMDPGELFYNLADEVSELEPTSSRLEIMGGKAGLNLEKTREFVEDVADHGYDDARIVGKDSNGANLSGTNEDFSLSVPCNVGPENARERAQHIFETYAELKRSGQIRVTPRDAVDLERLQEIKRRHG